jgi:hydrogenase-4 component E
MSKQWFDVAHLLPGSVLVLSFFLLYQDRIEVVINVFARQSMALSLSVAWQALAQDAPHLIVIAVIALVVKSFLIPNELRRIHRWMQSHHQIEDVIGSGLIPTALHRIIRQIQSRDRIEEEIGSGQRMLMGLGLVALSILLVQPVGKVSTYVREDLIFALAVILLGLLMMITRRNVVTQAVGFMSLENGLILAAIGAIGMPLAVEISVAFSILIAFIVFVLRIRERFDTHDESALDRFRSERRDAL